MNNVPALLGWALYISEGWYAWRDAIPCPKKKLYAKARGIVLYDRVLNEEFPLYKTYADNARSGASA